MGREIGNRLRATAALGSETGYRQRAKNKIKPRGKQEAKTFNTLGMPGPVNGKERESRPKTFNTEEQRTEE